MSRCPSCPKTISTTAEGVLRQHKRSIWLGGPNYRSEPCPGSGQPAAFESRLPRAYDEALLHGQVAAVPAILKAAGAHGTQVSKRQPTAWASCPRCGRKVRAPGSHVKPGSRQVCR